MTRATSFRRLGVSSVRRALIHSARRPAQTEASDEIAVFIRSRHPDAPNSLDAFPITNRISSSSHSLEIIEQFVDTRDSLVSFL